MNNRFEELKNKVLALENDFSSFYGKGTKAAGVRVRKAMQDLKELAEAIRVEIQSSRTDG